MSSKMIDVIITLDGLKLKDNESVDDLLDYLSMRFETAYQPIYEVTYEETVDD